MFQYGTNAPESRCGALACGITNKLKEIKIDNETLVKKWCYNNKAERFDKDRFTHEEYDKETNEKRDVKENWETRQHRVRVGEDEDGNPVYNNTTQKRKVRHRKSACQARRGAGAPFKTKRSVWMAGFEESPRLLECKKGSET